MNAAGCQSPIDAVQQFSSLKTIFLTLVMMGTDLSYDEGGLKVPPPFLFVKTVEKVIRLCTVLKKNLFDWQF